MRRKFLIVLTVDVALVFFLTLIIDLLLIPCLSSTVILVLLLNTIILLFASLFANTHCFLCLTDPWGVTLRYNRVVIIRVSLLFLRFFQVGGPHNRSSLLHFFDNRRVHVFGSLLFVLRLLGFFLWCDNLRFGI